MHIYIQSSEGLSKGRERAAADEGGSNRERELPPRSKERSCCLCWRRRRRSDLTVSNSAQAHHKRLHRAQPPSCLCLPCLSLSLTLFSFFLRLFLYPVIHSSFTLLVFCIVLSIPLFFQLYSHYFSLHSVFLCLLINPFFSFSPLFLFSLFPFYLVFSLPFLYFRVSFSTPHSFFTFFLPSLFSPPPASFLTSPPALLLYLYPAPPGRALYSETFVQALLHLQFLRVLLCCL